MCKNTNYNTSNTVNVIWDIFSFCLNADKYFSTKNKNKMVTCSEELQFQEIAFNILKP